MKAHCKSSACCRTKTRSNSGCCSDSSLRPIYEVLSKNNPIPVKAALELLGICSARARLPIVEADDEQKAEVRRALEAHGLLTGSAA